MRSVVVCLLLLPLIGAAQVPERLTGTSATLHAGDGQHYEWRVNGTTRVDVSFELVGGAELDLATGYVLVIGEIRTDGRRGRVTTRIQFPKVNGAIEAKVRLTNLRGNLLVRYYAEDAQQMSVRTEHSQECVLEYDDERWTTTVHVPVYEAPIDGEEHGRRVRGPSGRRNTVVERGHGGE